MKRLSAIAGLAALLGSAAIVPAAAQDYPVDTVRLVTHSSPGGGTDVFLRQMAPHLSKVLGVEIVVENIRGGSGATAIAAIAQGPKDGSLFYGTTPTFINTSILGKPQFTYEDMAPVVNLFMDPQVVYTRADSPDNDLKTLVARAKETPQSVKFGVSTPASLDRQVMERLKKLTGIDVGIVTHDGGGDLLINVLNGTLDAGVGEMQELLGQIEAKEIKVLAVYTDERLEQLPDVATAQEQGIDLSIEKFRGIAGPKDLPPEVIQAWEQAIPKLMEEPEFKAWYTESALIPTFMDHEEYAAFMTKFADEQKAFFTEYGITSDE